MNDRFWRHLTGAMGIVAALLLAASFGMKAVYHESRKKEPKIMIKQSAWTRLTSQPCNVMTIKYTSSGYIICERKRDARPIRSSTRGDRASRSRSFQSTRSSRTQKEEAKVQRCRTHRTAPGCEIQPRSV